jgi:hypothetical protein
MRRIERTELVEEIFGGPIGVAEHVALDARA